ncbi:hypothetical protein [Arthrobacter sp. 24S4-2]|uniref:hypothetical protein n=1 Tax=Arthrobacter sp. 24S4-2 TaxID=2575374 RepID=UPI0015863693|nr:hypothetical protein [Arthrobacter sp. 24S4-2]
MQGPDGDPELLAVGLLTLALRPVRRRCTEQLCGQVQVAHLPVMNRGTFPALHVQIGDKLFPELMPALRLGIANILSERRIHSVPVTARAR